MSGASLLSKTVCRLRAAYHNGELSQPQIQRLTAIDFPFDVHAHGVAKRVIALETMTYYGSMTEAAVAARTTVAKISTCCAKLDPLAKTTGGLHWITEQRWNGFKADRREELRRRVEHKRLASLCVCAETGETYSSPVEAARANNLLLPDNSHSIRRNDLNGTAGGRHWVDGNKYRELLETRPELIRQWRDQYEKRRDGAHVVVCVETGRSYPSARAAAEALGANRRNLQYQRDNINAYRNLLTNTALGYHWADPEWYQWQSEHNPRIIRLLREGGPQIRSNQKCVVNETTGDWYFSTGQAAQHLNITRSALCNAIRDRRPIAGGLWKRIPLSELVEPYPEDKR